jgi:hypothetical protein
MTGRGGARLALASLLLLLATLAPALAHRTSLAHVAVERGAETRVVLTLSAHDLAIALGIEADLARPAPIAEIMAAWDLIAAYLDRRLSLRAGAVSCAPGALEIEEARAGEELRLTRRFACPAGGGELTLGYRLFFDIDREHRAILDAGGRQAVLDRGFTTARIEAAPSGSSSDVARLLVLGIEHILLGFDHVLFVLALLLGLPSWRAAVATITAFTLAHSLTLALAWFGVVHIPARLVETAIALSIAYVAAENMIGRGGERRWIVAGLFGLVHGLGFYSVLADLGFERANAALVLFGFNLGVELGQLAILAAAAPVLWWASRHSWRATGVRLASAACLLVALWWAAERALV